MKIKFKMKFKKFRMSYQVFLNLEVLLFIDNLFIIYFFYIFKKKEYEQLIEKFKKDFSIETNTGLMKLNM